MSQPTNQIMHIALTADARYIEPLETVLKSVMCCHRHVHFHLIHHNQYDEQWFAQINRSLKLLNSHIHSVLINNELFAQLRSGVGLPESSFYRMAIPQLIEADRVLYLDSDVVVRLPLNTFYWQDFSGCLTVAVPDMFLMHPDIERAILPHLSNYFNSGVLLMNVALWRETQFTQYLTQVMAAHPHCKNGDQDILNIALDGKWQPEKIGYNYQTHVLARFVEQHAYHYLGESTYCPNEQLAIVHFSGQPKPWNDPTAFYAPLYQQYHQMTWETVISTNAQFFQAASNMPEN
ncbi:glycosyltransferase family 8 protein [Kingella negevensis]|uniref:glycosyltransferase family 8 protein n=1 Tax=Kingella negevensis TaxID=1522312 RepID=UPI0025430BBA|nr:glycosyltransferase family 8 protein [Kingella negevensis]WII92722.1 glycosyltransferase family 8 protein [Kingella negevensis]